MNQQTILKLMAALCLAATAWTSSTADELKRPDAKAQTVESLVDSALAKNPQLTAARKKWEAAKQKAPQARAFDDPMVGVDIERMGVSGLDKYSNTEWMVSQKLPWFGKREARERVALLEAEVHGFRYLEMMRDVRADVIGASWNLWLAEETVKITETNRALAEQFERVARSRYETGGGTQADVLRAQVELAKWGNDLITMQRDVPVAVAALNKLLNAPPQTPRRAPESLELPKIELSLDEMLERARQFCCILMSFLRETEAREVAVRVAQLESSPDFEVRVEARQMRGHTGFQEFDTGVFINFPWLWRDKYKAMVREAQEEVAMAEGELQDEINMTSFEVKELHTKLDTAMRTIKLYEDTVLPQARQLVDSTRAAYQTGKASFLELIDALRTLQDFQLEYFRSRADYGKTHAKLDAIIAPWGEREFATGLVTPDMK